MAQYIPGVLDNRGLHSKANAKKRNSMLSGDAHGFNLSFKSARAKSRCHEHSMKAYEMARRIFWSELLGVNPLNINFGTVLGTSVN